MKKDLYMKNPNEKIVIQSDDLKYDGKNIVIPSYYAGIISEYLANVDLKNANFKYNQIKRIGFKVSRPLWKNCLNSTPRNLGINFINILSN